MNETLSTDVRKGGLAAKFVPMDAAGGQSVLARLYGLTGTLKRFDTEKDDTFRVITENGSKYVLKISNLEEGFEELDFQNSMLRHIEARDPFLPVPRVVPNLRSQSIDLMTDASGAKRHVRLLTYIDGKPLCETKSNARERVEIGKMLARLRHATKGFSHPGENRGYAWDVQHLLSQKHLLEDVDDPVQCAALAAGLERFAAIEPRLRNCRQQVLHNDFSKSNLVVDHEYPAFITGVIDFGDAVKTAIAVDVSTALLNQLPETPDDDLFRYGRDIMSGYLSLADLTDEELALIPHLVMGRVIVRALLTLWRVKLFPDNERYIMRNTDQGWHQLDWFLARSPEQISSILMPYSTSKGTPK